MISPGVVSSSCTSQSVLVSLSSPVLAVGLGGLFCCWFSCRGLDGVALFWITPQAPQKILLLTPRGPNTAYWYLRPIFVTPQPCFSTASAPCQPSPFHWTSFPFLQDVLSPQTNYSRPLGDLIYHILTAFLRWSLCTL